MAQTHLSDRGAFQGSTHRGLASLCVKINRQQPAGTATFFGVGDKLARSLAALRLRPEAHKVDKICEFRMGRGKLESLPPENLEILLVVVKTSGSTGFCEKFSPPHHQNGPLTGQRIPLSSTRPDEENRSTIKACHKKS